MAMLQTIMDKYNYIFYTTADQRTLSLLFMGGPGPILLIITSYLYFCLSLGPRIMKNRRPFDLRNIVMVYNIFQILMSIMIFYQGIMYMSAKEFRFACEPTDFSDTPRAIRLDVVTEITDAMLITPGHKRVFFYCKKEDKRANDLLNLKSQSSLMDICHNKGVTGSWLYAMAKITELLDTVFFVLRKKNNQVSFLHVYHHTIMCLGVWVTTKYYPAGHGALMGTLNSFVHIIMYTYYFISGLGPKYQKYIWWKKYVTVLQLIQFSIILYHNTSVLFISCAYPRIVNISMCINSVLFLYMFGKFYINNYIKNKTRKPKNEAKKKDIKKGKRKNIIDVIFNL